jgi:hypothetical protein
MHTIAEELEIEKSKIDQHFDRIERELLDRFYKFVRDRREKFWIHWNMKNIVFGFEHLEQRYRTLHRQEPPAIPVEVRISLNEVLRDRYGSDYAKNPRMLSLMLLNGERDTRFLDGKEESEAFKRAEFIRMHSSTISKVEFFGYIIQRMNSGRLKVDTNRIPVIIDKFLDNRGTRVSLVIFSLIGGTFTIWKIYETFRSIF